MQDNHVNQKEVSLLWSRCDQKIATLVLAHGAGAPMDSPFMDQMTRALVAQRIEVVRFEFPYMAERRISGKKRPPSPKAQLLATWKQVIDLVRQTTPGPLAIGGKSMGGRMASLVADEERVSALVCLGYPFYAAGRPEKPRIDHLVDLQTPTLIIQGERDALGDRETVEHYTLSDQVRIEWVPTANHDLKPLKRSGLSHSQSIEKSALSIVRFLAAHRV
ncbi:alpha/beta fold hydrolase [Pseudomonas luteola]|uniref:alpha/beta fold hydrolase n=1 Tax=Pseudomonas luteola TaxID=47886 RepID=UPI00388EC00F